MRRWTVPRRVLRSPILKPNICRILDVSKVTLGGSASSRLPRSLAGGRNESHFQKRDIRGLVKEYSLYHHIGHVIEVDNVVELERRGREQTDCQWWSSCHS